MSDERLEHKLLPRAFQGSPWLLYSNYILTQQICGWKWKIEKSNLKHKKKI